MRSRIRRNCIGAWMYVAFVAVLATGCGKTHDEFRAVATPAIHNGVSQILNGLLDGLFAAIAVEPGGGDDASP